MFISTYATAQRVNQNYVDKYEGTDGVFTHTEIYPCYNGSFIQFMLKNGHYDSVYEVISSLKRISHAYKPKNKQFVHRDTADVKFILSKKLVISDLTIKNLKSDIIKKDLIRIIKLSAAQWRPAIMDGRPVSCWVNMKVYYSVELKNTLGLFDPETQYNNDEKLNIDYKIFVKN
jgi:hypothetical protein